MTRTLLILQDSPEFGGHEAMFLRFLPAVVADGGYDRIVMRHPAGNRTLAKRMEPFLSDRFEVGHWNFAKRRAEPYLAGFRTDYARAVRRLFKEVRPTATLLLQGRIENCVVPLLAAPTGSFIVSYVPMAHRMADIGRSAIPGDWVRRRLYRRPDRFIVPGPAIVGQVRAAGGRSPVVVADNVVASPPRPDRGGARAALRLDPSAHVALFLGRLDTRQKGLDTLVQTIRRQASALSGWTFLFVGSGDGEEACRKLANDLAGRIDIRSLSWTDSPHAMLAAADLMLMPSRWEGVPLVMLEAMTYGLPILASDIDVFRDYLPEANRIDFTRADLAQAMGRAVATGDAYRERTSLRLGETGLDRSAARFVSALDPTRIAA
jgi:glycosyltransferase involved in cell wall biosynthesis